MSDAPTSSNALTDKASSFTVLAIDPALAHHISVALAQVLALGYGDVHIVVADHAVKFIHTKLSEKF